MSPASLGKGHTRCEHRKTVVALVLVSCSLESGLPTLEHMEDPVLIDLDYI